MSKTPTYNSWSAMWQRCTRSPFYVKRGIKVCSRWKSFSAFFADMGERPPERFLERINNKGHYEPANCKWATRSEQTRNRKSNIWLTHNGKTLCVQDWGKKIGINAATIRSRLSRGHSVTRALSPLSFHGNNRHTKGRTFGRLNP